MHVSCKVPREIGLPDTGPTGAASWSELLSLLIFVVVVLVHSPADRITSSPPNARYFRTTGTILTLFFGTRLKVGELVLGAYRVIWLRIGCVWRWTGVCSLDSRKGE